MNKMRELDAALAADLKVLLGDRVTTSRGVRDHHGKDESYYPYAPPDAVAFPHSTEEVRDIVNLCRRYQTPIIPYGVGTSLEGHVLATRGGVCIDMGQMNKVLAVHDEDLDAMVQAGVTRKAAERGHPAHRPVLPDRSRRGRDDRRHGGDARLGHERGALRHDARERARR